MRRHIITGVGETAVPRIGRSAIPSGLHPQDLRSAGRAVGSGVAGHCFPHRLVARRVPAARPGQRESARRPVRTGRRRDVAQVVVAVGKDAGRARRRVRLRTPRARRRALEWRVRAGVQVLDGTRPPVIRGIPDLHARRGGVAGFEHNLARGERVPLGDP